MTEGPLILASGSPRRSQLLDLIGVQFTVNPADVDETPFRGEDPIAYASRAAREKANAVAGHAGYRTSEKRHSYEAKGWR